MGYINRYEELLKKMGVGFVRINNLLLREYNQIIIPWGPVIQKKPEKPILYSNVFTKLKGKLIWWSWFGSGNKNSQWYAVIKKNHTEINEYISPNIRNQVRKGLKSNLVKRVTAQILLNKGYPVYKKAIGSHSTIYLSKKGFNKNIEATIGFEDILHYWGIFNNNFLIGYAVVYCYGKQEANISEIRINNTYNKHYPSYALFHVLSNEYLNNQSFEYISDGYKNLLHVTNIQSMLIKKFGFEKVGLNLELAIRSPYNIIINLLFPFRFLFRSKTLSAVFKLADIYKAQKKRLPK